MATETQDKEMAAETQDKEMAADPNLVQVERIELPVGSQYAGVLRPSISKSSRMTKYLFVPHDRKIPIMRIITRQYERLKNHRIVVAYDSWPKKSRYPHGHFVKSLGIIGDKETENEALLLEHDVPHTKFPEAVLSCLPEEGDKWEIPEQEFANRADFRRINVCSVDPPGCTDIDDALHYRELGDGLCEVGVHIADVSYFVKPGTAMDKEAANRGTTVYLSDRRIDMIPGLLSSNLCSLIENQDRLSFSAIWKMRKSTADVIDVRFTRSIINSKASLTYEKAQTMIDDVSNDGVIHLNLRGLNDLAKKLKAKRIERGALVLARADEIRFVEVESETHESNTGLEIQQKRMVETNSMVEEFMLLANIAVANKILSCLPNQALLRRHPKPSKANFDDLIESAKGKGFLIEAESGKSLSDSLDRARLPNDDFFNLMLRMIATRCMTPAAYFCSGYVDPEVTSFTHFGLAADLYTHFTSPIRRYADLLVHRLLASSIGGDIDKSLQDKDNIQLLCDHINYRHRMAQLASRASARLHTVLYIKSKQELREEAYVFCVRQNAIQVLIPRIAFECTYFLEPSDAWKFDVSERSQTNAERGVTLKQFDKLKVRVTIATRNDVRFSDKIQVKILDPPIDDLTEDSIEIKEEKDLHVRTRCVPVQGEDMDLVDDEAIFICDQLMSNDAFSQIKKKIRLNLIGTNSSKPVVVIPSDDLEKYISNDITLLGPGLMMDDSKVVATKSGILKMRNNNLFWVDSHQKRYVAVKGECVIGVVRSKSSLHVRVDINSSDLATLSLLAFEGANKRNKPNLSVGDLVYAKVLSANKHVETELVCMNSNGKQDGLGLIGDKGGTLLRLSIDTARVLLSTQSDILEKLGETYRYEIAVGMNGHVWINSNESSTIVHIVNTLKRLDKS